AVQIGKKLCDTAIWDEKHTLCNWMGRVVENASVDSSTIAAGAVGAHLYGGSTGIALFLSELYGQTKDPLFARTALGAIKRSIRCFQKIQIPVSPLSFYSGKLGVAYVAVRLNEQFPEAN